MDEARFSKGLVASFILISLLSFALGYLWGYGSTIAPIVIEKCSDA